MKDSIFNIMTCLVVVLGIMFVLLFKFIPLEIALLRVSFQSYNQKSHNCEDFSKDLVKELAKLNIQSKAIYGNTPETMDKPYGHVWVGVWFEPQTGEFTSNYIY